VSQTEGQKKVNRHKNTRHKKVRRHVARVCARKMPKEGTEVCQQE